MRLLAIAKLKLAKDGTPPVNSGIIVRGPTLQDKIQRLGHTLVFFRAGALAYLEELRDELVIKWVRMIQGEVLKRVRGRVFEKKRDQRLD